MEILTAEEIKQQVSLVGLLARLGFQPKKTSGKEAMYLSMLRPSDTSPSLAVNDQLGVWYDHGSGKGGTVIDFAKEYWSNLAFPEVLEKIQTVYFSSPLPEAKPLPKRKRLAVKLPNYKVEELKPLGNNQVITDYLISRAIWGVENDLLSEVYYYVEDEKKLKKHFFAVGWMNEFGGWEVRNKHFKDCLGKKSLTILNRDKKSLVVFEGYMNYLSWRSEHKESNSSVIVLNSLNNLGPAKKIALTFSSVLLYFDRDQAGRAATVDFKIAVPQAADASGAYLGYNDYNELLIAKTPKSLQNANRFTQGLESVFQK